MSVPPDQRPTNPAITARVRELCTSLPEVEERPSHGECTWFVRGKKVFVQMSDHHHDDRLGLWCAAPPGVMVELVEQESTRFFRPPYVGAKGWLGVYLDVPDVDWDELREIVRDAYRTVAPAKLAALLDD